MTDTQPTTPDDLRQANQQLTQENAQLKAELQWLKEQVGLARHRLFAPKGP